MTAMALLAALRTRGVVLAVEDDALDVDAPLGVLTPDLREALVAHKAELLALLREPTPPAPDPVGTLRAGGQGFAESVALLLRLPLARFAEAPTSLEVWVPWHPETLWFVPGETDVATRMAEGIGRGRVWTARELADLLALSPTPAQARTVARAKLELVGEVVEVRPRAGSAPCHVCHRRCWWRSVHGRTACATCHPPAAPGLVAAWLDPEPAP